MFENTLQVGPLWMVKFAHPVLLLNVMTHHSLLLPTSFFLMACGMRRLVDYEMQIALLSKCDDTLIVQLKKKSSTTEGPEKSYPPFEIQIS